MKNILLVLAVVFAVPVFVFAQTATPTPDEDVVKISTNLIQIDVTVTDKKGNIVTDLKPEDFEIYENGEKQSITNFSFVSNVKAQTETIKNSANSNVPVPPTELKAGQVRRTLALVVDDLSLSFESVYQVRRALKKFVDEQMQAGDLVAIIRTGAGIGALQQFTSDKKQLYAAIEKVRWNPQGRGRIGAFQPAEPTALEQAKAGGADISDEQLEAEKNSNRSTEDFRESVFATGTLGALKFIIGGMNELPGRKSIVLFSDGFQLFDKTDNGSQEQSRIFDFLNQLTDLANRASVVVYTLDARGLQSTALTAADNVIDSSGEKVSMLQSDRSDELFETQQGLIYLARQTGGAAIINNNDLSDGVRKILNDQSYYLVGYQPDSNTFDEKTRRFNKLTVKVRREGLTVRYRNGFFNIKDEKIAKQTTVKKTPSEQINSALASPFAVSEISLRLNTLFGNDAKGSFVRSLLHVNAQDLKFTEEKDGSRKAVFDVLAVSFGDNGQVIDQTGTTYTFTAKNKESFEKIMKDGFVYYFTFQVKKPGAYQYRVAIRDSQTEKVGSASQFIEVPNLKKEQLTTSSIILENFTREQWQALSDDAPKTVSSQAVTTDPMTDTSLRRFKRGTVLRFGYEIYNSKLDASKKPNLTTQIRIYHDGKLLLDGKQTPLDLLGQTDLERIKNIGALGLGSEMPAGDYILQIIVTDNLAKDRQKIASQFVQFELVE
jgi:VWFA-related protein